MEELQQIINIFLNRNNMRLWNVQTNADSNTITLALLQENEISFNYIINQDESISLNYLFDNRNFSVDVTNGIRLLSSLSIISNEDTRNALYRTSIGNHPETTQIVGITWNIREIDGTR